MNLWLIHLTTCAFMTGLIWVIQILHYPAFADVDKSRFDDFHSRHTNRITWIVAPVMGIELLTGFALVFYFSANFFSLLNLLLILATWLSTAFLSVPCHNRLSSKRDQEQIEKLIKANWPRTALWSLRLVLLFFWFSGDAHANFL